MEARPGVRVYGVLATGNQRFEGILLLEDDGWVVAVPGSLVPEDQRVEVAESDDSISVGFLRISLDHLRGRPPAAWGSQYPSFGEEAVTPNHRRLLRA